MAEVRPSDVLFRAGGRCLELYGVPAVAGGGRPRTGELVEAFSRADGGTPLAGFYDADGLVRFAAQNVLRSQRMDTDGDGIRDSLALWFDDPRTSRGLSNNDFSTGGGWFHVGTPVLTPNYVSLGAIGLTKIQDDDGAASEYLGYNYVGKVDKPWAAGDGDGVKPVSLYWTKSDVEAPLGGGINITDTTAAGATRFAATIKADGAGAPVVSAVTGTYLGAELVATVGGRKVYRLHFLTTAVTAANEHVVRIMPSNFDVAGTGDLIVALYQIENAGSFPSGPILPTTTAARARALEDLTYTLALTPEIALSALAKVVRPLWMDAPAGPGIAPGIFAAGFNALPSLNLFFGSTVPGSVGCQIRDGTTIQGSQPNVAAGAAGSVLAVAASWWDVAQPGGGACQADGGAGPGAVSTGSLPFTRFGDQKVCVGRRIGAQQYLNAGLLDLLLVRGRFTRPELMRAAEYLQ